jgi:type IV secretory pathway ATPase VirB11/archaellum biosynthesis ATPase
LPSANAEIEIDLGKLNPLLKDKGVRIIDGSPDEKVRIMGSMGTRITDIFLTKEDIDRIIGKFSEMSKIPTNEGIYRVVVGNLILSAIISEVVGSRFVIKKMNYQQNQNVQIIPRK